MNSGHSDSWSSGLMSSRSLIVTVAAITLMVLAPFASGDNNWTGGGGDADWFKATNWDNGVVPPEVDENVNIYDSFSVDIGAGAADVGENNLTIGNTETATATTATLNVSGGSLTVGISSDDLRLGRNDADQVGAVGFLNQLGGDVIVNDYIKMSNAGSTPQAGSHYRISGGSLNVVDQLEFGRDDGTVASKIMFEVVGTGPSAITINDVKVNRVSPNSGVQPTFAFTIDDSPTGVTPIVVLDELQLGNNETENPGEGELYLELSLSGVPTANPIVLFQAKRLTMDEQFTGLPDNSIVSADYNAVTYQWRINYFDDGSNVVDAVVLTPVPEPNSVCLIALAFAPVWMLRRHRR